MYYFKLQKFKFKQFIADMIIKQLIMQVYSYLFYWTLSS